MTSQSSFPLVGQQYTLQKPLLAGVEMIKDVGRKPSAQSVLGRVAEVFFKVIRAATLAPILIILGSPLFAASVLVNTVKRLRSVGNQEGSSAQPQPAPIVTPQPRPTVKPPQKPVVHPTPQPQSQPAPVVQPKPSPAVQPRPQPVVQPKPQPQSQPAPVVQPKPSPAVQPRPQPVVQPKPQPQPQPQPQPSSAFTAPSRRGTSTDPNSIAAAAKAVLPSVQNEPAKKPDFRPPEMAEVRLAERLNRWESQGSSTPQEHSEALKHAGSGFDKVYYAPVPERGITMGFLDTSDEVKMKELKAYAALHGALQGTGVRIPQVMDDANKEGPLVVKKGSGKVEIGRGFWTQHIPNLVTFKPLMAALIPEACGAKNPIQCYKRLKSQGKHAEAQRLKADVKAMLDHCETICGIVGEVTLGINKESGEVYLIDVAPNGERTAKDQTDGVRQGLLNIYERMEA